MRNVKPPKVAEQPVDVPSVEDLQRLLEACAGNGFEDRRDSAIIRLFADSGLRLAELCGLSRRSVSGKISQYEIDKDPFKLDLARSFGRGLPAAKPADATE